MELSNFVLKYYQHSGSHFVVMWQEKKKTETRKDPSLGYIKVIKFLHDKLLKWYIYLYT